MEMFQIAGGPLVSVARLGGSKGRPEALQSAETTRPVPVTNGDESALGITHIGRNQVFTSVFVDFLQFKVIVI